MKRVSILMGAYNCESTVEQSIKSILDQSYTHWEFIICDDGSIDNTWNILQEYKKNDKRIVLLKNSSNYGLTYTLNKCLSKATGEYCARMDADDICDKFRLEKQVDFLEKNNQYAFVTTPMIRFNEYGIYSKKVLKEGYSPDSIQFVKGSPFCHAPVMIRKDAYMEVGGYRDLPQTRGVEDYDLWFRLYEKNLKGYILEEPLYSMFDGVAASGRRTWKRRKNEAWVRWQGYRMLSIPKRYWIYILKPLALGCIPLCIYKLIHEKHIMNGDN